MARKISSKKSKASNIKRTSRNKTLQSTNFLNKSRMLVFVVLFALIGVAFLFRSYAQSDLPQASNDIVAAYIDAKPTVVSRDEKTRQLNWESHAKTYMALADGTLLCDDGNSEGVVRTGELPKGHLKQLHREIKKLDLESVSDEFSEISTEAVVNDYEGFYVASQDSSEVYTVDRDQAKPDKLAKMQDRIVRACDRANQKVDRTDARQPNMPIMPAQSAAEKTSSVRSRVMAGLFPKADALPRTSSTSQVANALDVATDQFNKINNERRARGVPALGRNYCLDLVAEEWSKYMAQAALSDPVHSNFGAKVSNKCPSYYWTMLGENVGIGGDSSSLFGAFMNSPSHRANILDSGFNYIGVGAYKNNSNGRIYVTHQFMRL